LWIDNFEIPNSKSEITKVLSAQQWQELHPLLQQRNEFGTSR
jgi:hypothetical protein